MDTNRKVIMFYNPQSGHSRIDPQCDLINAHFAKHQIDLQTVFVPKPDEEIGLIIEEAIAEGVNLFLAAGGDGTVSMVSTHLVGKDIPIGIIPLGTGNILSKALDIPQKLEQALDVITADTHNKVKIDTFKLNERFFILNISIGVSPKIMEAVDSDRKQHMGFFAYLLNFFQQLLGVKLHRVYINCDHQKSSYLASEILITNVGTAGVEPLTWSDEISLNDGSLDLLIFRTANVWNFFGLIFSVFTKRCISNPEIKFMKVNEFCRVESQSPLHTQADGDVIGETPFEIHVYPSSLTIITGPKHPTRQLEGVEYESV